MEAHESWREQCRAAVEINEQHGTDKALGYLVGEKLLNFVREADRDRAFAGELPRFVAEVRSLFGPHELRGYLDSARLVGALGHAATPAQVEVLRSAGALNEDVVVAAEDVLLFGRIREMLLEDPGLPD